MKILKNNYNEIIDTTNKPYPRELICEKCGSELEYEKSDLRIGALGCVCLDCPCCNHSNIIDGHEDEITLTVNNIEFPTHFYHTSKETGAVDCCNNEKVTEDIRKAVDHFHKNKNEYAWYTYTGNYFLAVFRYDGDREYEVIVSNNYYNTYIPFELKDY